MALDKLTPMIYTADLQATVDFYVQTLGFTCLSIEPDWGWARVKLDPSLTIFVVDTKLMA